MRDFSIESAQERIHYPKIKEYFEEVIKSYYSESYRSSIVILYSIVMTDLLLKLDELKDLHSDTQAKNILDKINEIKVDKPTSAEWEKTLIEWVGKNTNLIDNPELLNLRSLQQYRHLCAHPVHKNGFDLYRPNKETTRALIVNSLNDILTKPPLLHNSIIDDIINDISKIKSYDFKEDEMSVHLESKYLNKLADKTALKLIKTLWKFVFRLDNADCKSNRKVNLIALKSLTTKYLKLFKDEIINDKDFYSEIDFNFIKELIDYLNDFPEVYEFFLDASKQIINKTIQKNSDLEAMAFFKSKDYEEHIKFILNNQEEKKEYEFDWISSQTIIELYNKAKFYVNNTFAKNFLIQMFGYSSSFDMADTRYSILIYPYLKDFNKEEIKLIVSLINSNSQINSRRAARSSNRDIECRIDELYGENKFNYGKYLNFKT